MEVFKNAHNNFVKFIILILIEIILIERNIKYIHIFLSIIKSK